MRLKIILAAALVMGAAGAAPAASAAVAPQAAAAAPSARQLELSRRYVDLTMAGQFEDSIREMIVDQVAMDPNSRDLPEEDRRFLAELTAELTTDMIPRMLDQMVPVYARTFSEGELEALIAFFETDMGRSILSKTMESMPEANRAAMSVLPDMLEKMAARLCQHYGCTATELQELKREMRGETSTAPTPK